MKYNQKTTTILIVLGIIFTLSTIISNNLNFKAGNSNESLEYDGHINLYNKNLKISKLSGKIHIDNNWSDAKAAEICTGSGNFSDPYVIEDLVIDGGGSGSCIWIENTDVYFRIENCTVYNSGHDYPSGDAGMQFYNSTNGKLINNSYSSNLHGIYLEDSYNNTISGNTASNNDLRGINLVSSNNNTISGNTVNYNRELGMYLYNSDNNNILRNIASNNDRWGIYLGYSDNNTISGNTASNNGWRGISLASSNYNTISGNIMCYNVLNGLYMSSSNYNTISGNKFFGNIHSTIVEDGCIGNVFENNNYVYIDCKPDGLGNNLFFLLGFFFILSVVSILIGKKLRLKF